MPLGAKNKSKNIWNAVVEKCEKKLMNGKSQYSSLGGRECLQKVKTQSEGRRGRKEIPLGEMGCRHVVINNKKRRGEMDIKNLKVRNQSLLLKWLLRVASVEQGFWKEPLDY
ncbi:hypothetical protein H5410_055869 [Solanum commersonii]|uniref:Uncharacterized protein n=1 Tax=Solanum commersonii TaxID=4109 RepID=A0A9J5WKF7_SOLCO|nr:hypothetical protein H5410_055869 [Solanum commersonii]